MKRFFGILFLLTTAILVAVNADLFLDSRNLVEEAGGYDGRSYMRCSDVISGGQASLMFFLILCSSLLSFLPANESYFEELEVLWRTAFVLFGLTLLYCQFQVFQELECEAEIHLWPKLLLTLACMGCFFLAIIARESKFLGAVFLLLATAIGATLTLSTLSVLVHFSVYGYFSHIACFVGFVVFGAMMVMEHEVIGEK